MIKYIVLFAGALLLGGCFGTSPKVHIGQKAFEQEDTYIVYALEAEHTQNFKTAAGLFETVYKKSGQRLYLYRSLHDFLRARMFTNALNAADKSIKEYPKDAALKRYKILALVYMGKLEEAKKEALDLVKTTQDEDDFLLVSDIYIKQKHYNTALKYLESAYNVNHSTKLLDRISTILFVNLQRPKDAIAYLETYVHINGCVNNICERLAGFYSNLNNTEGMLATYMRMYNGDPNEETAQQIIKIYEYQQDYPKLMLFLERCGCNNELLLRLYIESGMYDKASVVAKKLYEKTYNPEYLAQSAIYNYENLRKHITKKELHTIINELTQAVNMDPKPLYLNYLGYLLIEHNIHIKKGIAYVRQALKKEPDSAYYIDSLALGYYKLHECKRAYRLIKRVVHDIGLTNREVREHYNMILKCVRKQAKKR